MRPWLVLINIGHHRVISHRSYWVTKALWVEWSKKHSPLISLTIELLVRSGPWSSCNLPLPSLCCSHYPAHPSCPLAHSTLLHSPRCSILQMTKSGNDCKLHNLSLITKRVMNRHVWKQEGEPVCMRFARVRCLSSSQVFVSRSPYLYTQHYTCDVICPPPPFGVISTRNTGIS